MTRRRPNHGFTGRHPSHLIEHAHTRRSSHLRRRPPGSGLLGNPATRGRSLHAAHAPDPVEPAATVGSHGHGDRGTSGDHHRPGRRARRHPQKHEHRGAGARSRTRQEVRKRRHQGPDHRLPGYDGPRSAGPHPLARHFWRTSGARQAPRGHRHASRPALRGPHGGSGVLGDDPARAPGNSARGCTEGPGAGAAAQAPYPRSSWS